MIIIDTVTITGITTDVMVNVRTIHTNGIFLYRRENPALEGLLVFLCVTEPPLLIECNDIVDDDKSSEKPTLELTFIDIFNKFTEKI